MNEQTLIRMNIKFIVCNTLTLETLNYKDDLMDLGLLDSLSLVQLMVALEDKFEMKIEPDNLDIDDYRSIQAMTNMIIRRSIPMPSLIHFVQ